MSRAKGPRLLWDENLSQSVPRALRELGYRTSYVGDADYDQPGNGSTDDQVIAHALQRNLVIVTSNHDMMQLCDERGQRFVWIDPRGRQLARREQVLLAFVQIDEWQAILEAGQPNCVRAMRSKCIAIESAEAARLATQRLDALQRRKRTPARAKVRPLGELLPPTTRAT
jgi:predicted nuclease of predicted toxin-antitoxin system